MLEIVQFPLWVFVAVLSRDVLILMGWSLVYVLTSNRKIEPRPLGKATTFIQMLLVVGVLFHIQPLYYHWLLHLTIAATLVSAIDYVWMGNQRLGMLEP